MPQQDEPTSGRPKVSPGPRRPKAATAAVPKPAGLFSLTIDADSARVVAIERVDPDGTRRPLTADEQKQLAKASGDGPIRRLVERAFEAGIEAVLGEEKDPPDSEEDTELSGMLLQSLIDTSKARALIKGKTLDREIIGTLIARAASPVS
jgi:hypothetical protein